MHRLGILVLFAIAPLRLHAQARDTVVLPVGDPRVDGSLYKPHLAGVVQTLTDKNGHELRRDQYTIDTFVEQRNGRGVFRLEFDPIPGIGDQAFHVETILDLKTTAVLHEARRNGTGKTLDAEIDGTHVTGKARAAADSAEHAIDATLQAPSYLFSFLDAAVNATKIRKGEVFRVPTFEFPALQTEWHTYRVAGEDVVDVGARKVHAWIIEERDQPRYISRRIWLIKEAPYLPRVEVVLRDSSVSTFVSTLIKMHDEKNSTPPLAVRAPADRITFASIQPVTRGSFDEQLDNALKQVVHTRKDRSTIVKLRIFASTEDAQRVQPAVQVAFNAAKMTQPALVIVGVSGFPDPETHVVLEQTTASTQSINPNGLAFLGGLASADGAGVARGLQHVVQDIGVRAADVIRISCFYESAPDASNEASASQAASQRALRDAFPNAATAFVNARVTTAKPAYECEGVARLEANPDSVSIFNPPQHAPSPFYSVAALVPATTLIFTGGVTIASAQEQSAHAAYAALDSAVRSLGGRLTDVVVGDNYWIDADARDPVRNLRSQYFGTRVPAATGVFFIATPAPHAAALMDLVVSVGSPP